MRLQNLLRPTLSSADAGVAAPHLHTLRAGAERCHAMRSLRLPRPELAVLLVLAAALNLRGLSRNGWANEYYSAAVRSMTTSWHDFIFGSFDAAGVMTVDKPPLALWEQAAFLVNREAAGERMERRYEQRLEEVRAAHGDTLKTTRFALIRDSEAGKWQADNAASWAGVVLADLGARLATVSDFKGPPVKEYSDEQVGRLQDAEVILIEGSPGTDRPDPESAALMRGRLFERLPAARAGRVEALHFFYPFSYGQGLEGDRTDRRRPEPFLTRSSRNLRGTARSRLGAVARRW